MNHCHTETETFTMQEKPISNSLSKTDSNEGSNPPRNFMPLRYGSLRYAIVDVEIGLTDHRIHDIGALRYDGAIFHKASKEELQPFLERVEYLCGHNIIHHDAKYLFEDQQIPWRLVDTLYLSPLLFPERPYHRLVKDDKLVSDQMNNPVNDCEKARDLLLDEMARWDAWPEQKRSLFTALLRGQPEFDGFLDLMGAGPKDCNLSEQIATVYRGCICQNADLEPRTGLRIGANRHDRSSLHHAGMGTTQLPERGVRHQEAAPHPLPCRLCLLQCPTRRPPQPQVTVRLRCLPHLRR